MSSRSALCRIFYLKNLLLLISQYKTVSYQHSLNNFTTVAKNIQTHVYMYAWGSEREKGEKFRYISHTVVILYLKCLCSVLSHTLRVVLDWFWLHSYSVFYCSYHHRRTLKPHYTNRLNISSPLNSRARFWGIHYVHWSHPKITCKVSFALLSCSSQVSTTLFLFAQILSEFKFHCHSQMHRTNEQANERCCIANVFTLFTLLHFVDMITDSKEFFADMFFLNI